MRRFWWCFCRLAMRFRGGVCRVDGGWMRCVVGVGVGFIGLGRQIGWMGQNIRNLVSVIHINYLSFREYKNGLYSQVIKHYFSKSQNLHLYIVLPISKTIKQSTIPIRQPAKPVHDLDPCPIDKPKRINHNSIQTSLNPNTTPRTYSLQNQRTSKPPFLPHPNTTNNSTMLEDPHTEI